MPESDNNVTIVEEPDQTEASTPTTAEPEATPNDDDTLQAQLNQARQELDTIKRAQVFQEVSKDYRLDAAASTVLHNLLQQTPTEEIAPTVKGLMEFVETVYPTRKPPPSDYPIEHLRSGVPGSGLQPKSTQWRDLVRAPNFQR